MTPEEPICSEIHSTKEVEGATTEEVANESGNLKELSSSIEQSSTATNKDLSSLQILARVVSK